MEGSIKGERANLQKTMFFCPDAVLHMKTAVWLIKLTHHISAVEHKVPTCRRAAAPPPPSCQFPVTHFRRRSCLLDN